MNTLILYFINFNFFYKTFKINKIKIIEITLEILFDYEFNSRN